jgi:hypothetical protein
MAWASSARSPSSGTPSSSQRRRESGCSHTIAVTSAPFSPQITASVTIPWAADSSCGRNVPTLTNVPVDSLKSSAMRPRNSRPAATSSGSARATASPVRKKPSSSKAAVVRSGRPW